MELELELELELEMETRTGLKVGAGTIASVGVEFKFHELLFLASLTATVVVTMVVVWS